jgi:MSHA biogenesis protein MshJ
MREQWRKLAARFDALLVRERVLVLVGLVVGVALIFDTLALQPLEARKKRLERQIAESRNSIKVAETVLAAQVPVTDPDDVRRSYRNALRQQLADIDQSMQGLQRGLVPPERMANLLEEMLSRSRGLQLLSLRTLPVKIIETPAAAPAGKAGDQTAKPAPKDPERTVYQHSFEITLQGSYFELHDYLAQLEKLPWQMFWGRISVQTEQYPRLRATLTVQTLSLSKAWLIV